MSPSIEPTPRVGGDRIRRVFVAAGAALIPLLADASAQEVDTPGPSSLVAVYPDFVERIDGNELVMRDGSRLIVDDGKPPKSFDERLRDPDLKDMFLTPYRSGRPLQSPKIDEDPGRARNDAFFKKMYGDCAKNEVRPKLRRVTWMPLWGGGEVEATTVNGVADHLEAAARELQALPERFKRYLVPNEGAYYCRAIAGTTQTSMHSYGVAIDINTRYSDYWRWPSPPPDPIAYRNQIPFEIVEIFERHGFIWGGKWYHFDTMHFEYRPELMGRN